MQLLLQFGATLFLAKFTGALPTDSVYDSLNVQKYDGSNFFDSFKFFSGEDPTHGFVKYLTQDTASKSGLAKIDDDKTVYLGVETTDIVQDPKGRQSVRLESTTTYTHGLFVADIAHMPGSICGVWPAFWTFGDNWPNNGEIDIIENVNTATVNRMTLHTSPGMMMAAGDTKENLVMQNGDCGAAGGFQGCGMESKDETGYGDGFNKAGGGVYVMEWTSESISIWHFQRSNIPEDITKGNPNPSSWSKPTAKFVPTTGSIDDHFKDHKITFDTTFCGDWAGQAWGQCEIITGFKTCNEWVAANGAKFKEAFWRINFVSVYKMKG